MRRLERANHLPGGKDQLEPGLPAAGLGPFSLETFLRELQKACPELGTDPTVLAALRAADPSLISYLHPDEDIRIENFRDTELPDASIDTVIGNVPFADLRLDYRGMKLALHDFFFAKAVDALKPRGILSLITSHCTLDKQNATTREYLASKADFVGAVRLPSGAFSSVCERQEQGAEQRTSRPRLPRRPDVTSLPGRSRRSLRHPDR
jgi:adenine-specific DNA methylase